MTEESFSTDNLTRRELLRFGTLAATGSPMTRFQPAMAGPSAGTDFDSFVPADKKLTAARLRAAVVTP